MGNANPKVSAIVPSYNHAPFLSECLRSALDQDFDGLEVVLVDDCSSDDSLEVARSISDPRLKVHANEMNLGAYATQNRALDLASGEWIAVLNSDDLWRTGKLRAQMARLSDARTAFSYTLGEQIDAEGKPLEIDQHAHWPRDARQDLLPWLLSSNRLLASSVVFRRGDVRFEPSLRYSGDWIAWLSLAERENALCVDQNLTAWRQHSTNSYTRTKAVTLEEIRVRRAILSESKRWLKARDDKATIRKGLSDCAIDLTALYVLVGHMRLAKQSAALAVRLAPGNSTAHKRLALSLMPSVLARRRLWSGDKVEATAKELRALAPIEIP